MSRRPEFPESLGDLAPGLLGKLLPRQFHFHLAERTNLGLDGDLAWQNGAASAAVAQACLARSRSGTLPFVSLGPEHSHRAQLHFQRGYGFLGGLNGDPAGAPIFRSPFSSAGFRQALGPWHGDLFRFRK
jgi:hypothetical protein